jgi:crotonobetaine/carnitine-CoA ligase
MLNHYSYDWTIEPNLRTLLKKAVALHGEKTMLIIEDGETVTYHEFKREVDRMAAVLKNEGVAKGDLVGVMLPNILLFPVTLFACYTLGAVMIPINATYRQEDARYVLNYSELGLLITTGELYRDTISGIRKDCPCLTKVIVEGGPVAGEPGVLLLADLLRQNLPQPEEVEIKPTDLATILFTSGTTGYPKGCMHDQTYWLYLAKKVVNYAQLTGEDCLLTAQPFYYMDPQWNVVATLMAGACLVLMKRFSPTRFWEHILRYKVTWCNAIMANLLYKTLPENFKEQHSMRLVACTVIPPALHAVLEEKTGVPWRANFGMTETGCDLLVPVEATHLVSSGCIGKPTWERQVRVVDEQDRDLPPGEVGEMLFRGKGIMRGYYKNPEATREAFRGGWFHTGDLVYMDEEGWLFFKGRKKDMVRRGGENISSMEVENVLISHPKVKDAAVLPVPDEVRGEEVKVYLLLREGETPETLTPRELAAYCSSRLAAFKVPRYYEYVKEFPYTPASGKVEKYKLKEAKGDLRLGSYDRVDDIWR